MLMKPYTIFIALLFVYACSSDSTDAHDAPPATDSSAPAKAPTPVASEWESFHFPSGDSLRLTGDFYEAQSPKLSLLLLHQARFSRGEYRETAKWLRDKGFTALAVDLRSGGEVNGIQNETALEAEKAGLGTEYVDAWPDVKASVEWLAKKTHGDVVVVGSSYSAGLALRAAKEMDQVRAAAAFSPGRYYKGAMDMDAILKGIQKPVFITSSKKEAEEVRTLVELIPGAWATLFVPSVEGEHGSKAMWKENDGHAAYRAAFLDWLNALEP